MKAFLTGVCVICVAYGILGFLNTQKGSGKMTRFICALCFLISLCTAVSGVDGEELSFALPAAADIDYSFESREALEAAIGLMLSNNGISFEKISVSSSENADGGIYINEITVFGTDDPEGCKRLIQDNTGLSGVSVDED